MHATMRHLIHVIGLIAPGLALAEAVRTESKPLEPLEIIRTMPMTYPPELSQQRIDEGEVKVMVWVDHSGRLMDWLLIGHTNPLFAKEVLDVLPKWKFNAARVQGQPVDTRTEVRIIFKNSEVMRVVTGDLGLTTQMKGNSAGRNSKQRIFDRDELDQPLDPVVEIAPRPPDRLGAVAREGIVVVEYLVDADGKVRMPMVISSDDEAFTNSVLLAISEWRFAVPRHSGQPVIARVRQQFIFSPSP